MEKISKMTDKKNLEEILKNSLRNVGLRLAILFGSLAEGQEGRVSDIDLALLFDHPVNVLDITNDMIELLNTDRIDIVDLRVADPLLSFEIARKGKVLFEREPGIFNQFYSMAFRRYIDTEKLRKAQRYFIERFLLERDLK